MDKALIEKYRDINTDHNWYDYVYEHFTERMEKVGIRVDQIYFSGFWSQGDGACFEGIIESPLRFLRRHMPFHYPLMRKLVAMGGTVAVTCVHSGRYYHEHSTEFSISCDEFKYLIDDDGDTRSEIADVLDEQLNYELADFADDVKEIFRGYMKELYRELEQEYDNLTSDESVWEAIVANDLHIKEEA